MPNSGHDGARTLLTAEEIRGVMQEFSVGRVVRAHAFNRGSRRFPKAVIESESGAHYLLKRRSAGDEDLRRAEFSHEVQAQLRLKHFPIARCMETRTAATWVVRGGFLYELFDFLKGDRFRRSIGEARESGLFLSRLHGTLMGWTPAATPPPPGGYHRSKSVDASWSRLEEGVRRVDADASREEIAALAGELRALYESAAEQVDRLFESSVQSTNHGIIHADFHPGNLLYVTGAPIALLDFDGVRCDRTVIDLANGALQFGMHSVGAKPVAQWNPTLNLTCVEAFLEGYAWPRQCHLDTHERAAVALLMVQAAIAECVPRVALSGRFDGRPGVEILRFLAQKTQWIWSERQRIATLCESCMSKR